MSTDIGILLTDALALKAHQGTKTVTRRPVDAKKYRWLGLGPCSDDAGPVHPARRCERHEGVLHGHLNSFNWVNFNQANIRGAGRAEVGGRVWVRECFAVEIGDVPLCGSIAGMRPGKGFRFKYRASGDDLRLGANGWRPSIHMPKWVSRTWGHIVSVRPCDLSGIDHAEAVREGFGSVPECLDAIRGLYPDTTWFWRVEWERIERPEVSA